MGDVVHRVVEVGGVAALAPAVPGRRVVVARQADRQREQVGALEREVGGVKGAEAARRRRSARRAPPQSSADERDDLVEDPRLVALRGGGRAPRAEYRGSTTTRRRSESTQ